MIEGSAGSCGSLSGQQWASHRSCTLVCTTSAFDPGTGGCIPTETSPDQTIVRAWLGPVAIAGLFLFLLPAWALSSTPSGSATLVLEVPMPNQYCSARGGSSWHRLHCHEHCQDTSSTLWCCETLPSIKEQCRRAVQQGMCCLTENLSAPLL